MTQLADTVSESLRDLAALPLSDEELARAALVDFAAERDGPVPVGTVLGWKLRAMVARGALREGDRLPSVRELAGFAEVNVNTARAVYGALEEEGLIASEQGRGTFVTSRAAALRGQAEIADLALEAARDRGIDPREVAAVLYAAGSPEEPGGHPSPLAPPSGDDAATIRRQLREQIGRLEAALGGHAWEDRREPAPSRAANAGPVPHLASIEELERTRDRLIDRLSRLRGEAQRRGARQESARAHREHMLTDPAGHRWEIVGSEETGEGDCRNWRVVPRFGPLGAIMGWWRVKVSSGCPLAGPREAVNRWSDQ